MRVASLLPRFGTLAKLFATGATVGPIVDSLHNQCLLTYDMAPISLAWPTSEAAGTGVEQSCFFCSSWTVPPLLGIAYIVLGGMLPRVFQVALDSVNDDARNSSMQVTTEKSFSELKTKAALAVTTTALIIKLSEFLETHPHALDELNLQSSTQVNNLLVMAAAALLQWISLDGTLAALLAAMLAGIGGPLSELPFVAHGFWHYLPQAADYLPLKDLGGPCTSVGKAAQWLLGENYQDLSLSSITGPCYFAVTMDAIALGRLFDDSSSDRVE